ncbi:MAG: alkaline phosphatase [Spirochaetes bacterium]|nr:MAG: alkaline phosphatase [Spirochaetota bacterium]
MKKLAIIIAAGLACAVLLGGACSKKPGPIRNVILIIGDGMGPQQIGLALTYARYAPRSVVPGRKLVIEEAMQAGAMGLVLMSPEGALVTDSAASATQYATGLPARPETVGLNKDGNAAETILELASRKGRATGLVSDTRITHATPAAFAAHRADRNMENEIAEDVIRSGADVLFSGGLRYFLPQEVANKNSQAYKDLRELVPAHIELDSKRKDNQNLLDAARGQGYDLVFGKSDMQSAKSGKLLGLFTAGEMPDGIQVTKTRKSKDRQIPTLREMTEKAIEILSRSESGFFLMVEAGHIDWAGHNSDAGRLIHEMLVLDETLGYVYSWAKSREDTLVLVAADHETGGVGFSYSRYNIPEPRALMGKAFGGKPYKPSWNYVNPEVLDRIYAQKMSFNGIRDQFEALPKKDQTADALTRIFNANVEFKISSEEAKAILADETNEYYVSGRDARKSFPKVLDFKEFYVAPDEARNNLMGRAISREQGIVWASGTHTSTPTILIALGPENTINYFRGLRHSTEVGELMRQALGL